MPGETAAPGTASGKTGTPSAQIMGTGFEVTVNAVDAYWNLVNTVSDTVGLTSSDTTATLPAAAALAAGTTNLTVYFNTNGSFTLTATDLSDGSKSPSTSPAITVSPAQFTAATGGGAIAADGATGTFTTLTGPSYTENASGNVGTGTIILNAPAGFVFDTGGTAPTVLITRLTGSGSNGNNINGVASGTAVAMTSVTSTQLVFTVTSASASGVTCKLTWQNVRVRPTAGTPLASGNLRMSGTASVVGLSTNANLGTLREVAGAASSLAILTQPSATATAGVAFAQQPVLQVRDQFGNLRSTANGVTDSTVVTRRARQRQRHPAGHANRDRRRWRGHLHQSVPQRRHQHHPQLQRLGREQHQLQRHCRQPRRRRPTGFHHPARLDHLRLGLEPAAGAQDSGLLRQRLDRRPGRQQNGEPELSAPAPARSWALLRWTSAPPPATAPSASPDCRSAWPAPASN